MEDISAMLHNKRFFFQYLERKTKIKIFHIRHKSQKDQCLFFFYTENLFELLNSE